MAEAPKPQRRRSRRNNVAGVSSAAPTADTTPSGVSNSPQPRARRRRVRRPRRTRVVREVLTLGAPARRSRLTRAIKREIKREGLDGPKVSVQQKITSTFGLVRQNTTGNVELELNFFLHPSLAKEANDGTAFGPVQALAAQYSLWKLRYLTVRFTPMVGASAVSGTVVRASLNMSQSPGTSNWSGLGTRLHVDMHPGQPATFHLRADQLGGPRDGGWWFTDTNEEGSQSAGPIIEVHTMGLTKSTFRNENWDGPLFLVEGIGMWQFANYNVKPALGSLERREGNAQVEVKATASQPITMEMPSAESPAVFMDTLEPEAYASPTGQTVGETIFQIVDVGATLAQNVAPPPFGWLIKGGWWFVKKLLKRSASARANTSEYVVYASLQDAQNNKPAIATETLQGGPKQTTLMVTQINSPNVGPNPSVAATPRAGPQPLHPGDEFRVASRMVSELFINVPKGGSATEKVPVPVSAIPGVLRKLTGTQIDNPLSNYSQAQYIQTPWYVGVPGKAPGENPDIIPSSGFDNNDYDPRDGKGGYVHSLYKLIDPRFTNQSGHFEYLEPEVQDYMANFSVLQNFSGFGAITKTNGYVPVGKVVASHRIWSGTNPQLDMVIDLIKITKGYTFGHEDTVRDMVLAVGDTANRVNFVPAPYLANQQSPLGWSIFERDVPDGAWLLGVSYTNAVGTARGADIPTVLKLTSYSRIETTFSPVFPYGLSGQMLPATSIDMLFEYVDYKPPSQELIEQLRALNVSFVLPTPSSDERDVEIPCVLPDSPDNEDHDTSEDSDGDGSDSVENFILELGNEMIDLPRRWLNDPEFSRFLDM